VARSSCSARSTLNEHPDPLRWAWCWVVTSSKGPALERSWKARWPQGALWRPPRRWRWWLRSPPGQRRGSGAGGGRRHAPWSQESWTAGWISLVTSSDQHRLMEAAARSVSLKSSCGYSVKPALSVRKASRRFQDRSPLEHGAWSAASGHTFSLWRRTYAKMTSGRTLPGRPESWRHVHVMVCG
jgi:hypothetical protein